MSNLAPEPCSTDDTPGPGLVADPDFNDVSSAQLESCIAHYFHDVEHFAYHCHWFRRYLRPAKTRDLLLGHCQPPVIT